MNKENPRGLFERPLGSGVWWINYYVKGKQHCEKVGRKSDALKLYGVRKADATIGRKLPELRATKAVTMSVLIDEVLEFVTHHKDRRNYVSKAAIVRNKFGSIAASEIKPQDIERWLRSHCKSAATWNRYRAFFSLCYQRGLKHGKVLSNPARQVDHRKESEGRARYLTEDEYNRLHEVISRRFPEHLAEFVVSVQTGTRLTEQYSCRCSQMYLDRRAIELTKTKNGSDRTVYLNADAVAALASRRNPHQKSSDHLFPREGATYDTRSWFKPCLKEAKITGYLWHCNRHTFCSWLAMAGASTKDIQVAAGHKTITMAARYSQLSPIHSQSVVDLISGKVSVKHAHQ
jgi:site-specific recombinase XerD